LVSVVVPAYNAAATLDETLISIRAQTYANLDIVVVDDGSSDGTAEVVLAHARSDPRIRLVRQANGGVAAARNAGIREAKGDLVAPVDADDVWAPTKIERQVEALRRRPAAVLVYTWFASIDARGRITGYGGRHQHGGDALRAMCRTNLVGNGSGALMRKAAVIAAGGYDETLRARGGQGCEDYKLYLRLAALGEVVAVPEFLTGYRVTPHNMSSDTAQMCRSHLLVMRELTLAHPELAADLRAGRRVFTQWLILRALRELRLMRIGELVWTLARQDGRAALALLVTAPAFLLRRAALKAQRLAPARKPLADTAKPFPIGSLEA
jgi:glycosyltransferase involved in cell wall biosynthesis